MERSPVERRGSLTWEDSSQPRPGGRGQPPARLAVTDWPSHSNTHLLSHKPSPPPSLSPARQLTTEVKTVTDQMVDDGSNPDPTQSFCNNFSFACFFFLFFFVQPHSVDVLRSTQTVILSD